MDFNQLTAPKGTPGSVADWFNNSLIAPTVPTFIAEAQAAIQTELRHWRMIPAPATGTMTVATSDGQGGASTPGTDVLSVPTDFLDPYMLVVTANSTVPGNQQRIEMKTLNEVIGSYNYNGLGNRIQQQPLIYYLSNAGLSMDSPPDQAYPYLLYYFQQIPTLSSGSPTNWLTQYYPRLFRCAISVYAVEWLKETGQGQFDRTYWMQQMMEQMEKAKEESAYALRSSVLGEIQIGGGPPGSAVWSY